MRIVARKRTNPNLKITIEVPAYLIDIYLEPGENVDQWVKVHGVIEGQIGNGHPVIEGELVKGIA